MSENILQIAEKLNSEVARLNNERSKMEGMLESAKSNFERAVQTYNQKYGVMLTAENLQSEYNEVYAKTKGSILDLQEKIDSIKRGDYKKSDKVSFNLEPDVEPIRSEKPVMKLPIDESFSSLSQADDISGSTELSNHSTESVDESILPSVDSDKKRGRPRKTGVVSPELLKQAVAAESHQEVKPIIPDGMLLEDNDESVNNEDVLGKSDEREVSEVGNIDFGSIDFSFGDSKSVDKTVETSKNDALTSEDEVKVDLGSVENTNVVSNPVENVSEKKDVNPYSLDFGGFGDINFENLSHTNDDKVSSNDSVAKKPEEETISPAGWGSDFEFNFEGTNDLFGNAKFGE